MQLIAQKEAAEFVKTGAKEFRQNVEIRLTPGAKDIFTEAGIKVVFDSGAAVPASSPAPAASNAPGGYSADDVRLFASKEANEIKEQICNIGRRIWMREYCDGNGARHPRCSRPALCSRRVPARTRVQRPRSQRRL